MTKQYDRAYFRRWYHDPRTRISSARSLEQKVHLAVSAAEYVLGRRIRTVLDVGCGEARWHDMLKRMGRGVAYVGVDSSDYVARAHARSRRVLQGHFGDLRSLRLRTKFDLIVCADVLQYIPPLVLLPGLRELRGLLGGVAYVEAFTGGDDMEGDMEGWHVRSEAYYRRAFRSAGLAHCGLNCFVDARKLKGINQLELCR